MGFSGSTTPSDATEGVKPPSGGALLLLIQYPTHQMVVPTHVCVERSSHINEDIQMLLVRTLLLVLLV